MMYGLPLPVWLVALSIIPLLGGAARLLQLWASGAPAPLDLRFAQARLPVALHIATAAIYCLAGAFQFDSALRSRRPALHRGLGRLLVACGAAVGFTGLWLTLATDIPLPLQGALLRAVRTVVGTAMVSALVLGVLAIRAGRVRCHQAWMARAYALAQGAGTQALLLLPPTIVFGDITGLARDLAMTAAWLLNLVIVEWVLHRPTSEGAERPALPN